MSREEKAKFMQGLVNEFGDFVTNWIQEGMAEYFEDHNDFLRAALDAFIDIIEESMEE